MRFSTPCSRMRSSAGEISSASFGFSADDGFCGLAKASAGNSNPALVMDALRKKLRRLERESGIVVSPIFDPCVLSQTCFDVHPPWKGCTISRCRVDPQDLDELGDLAQMAEGVAGGFVVAAEEVHIEHVLPGPSAHGARLDLAQADVAQGENAERLEQCAGQVLHF